MLSANKPLLIIASLLIAFLTLFIIEKLGYPENIQSYFFGDIKEMGQLKSLLKQDWIKGLKSVMFLLFAFFVVYIMFFVLVFEIFALFYFLISSKWRKPKVFISYKNTNEDSDVDTTKMAVSIKSFLEKKGFKVFFFEYTKTLHHDQVNFQIQEMLRSCNAMVVIPDPYHQSYVDSEILYASTERKPVFIIKHTKDQKLPNTANSGHTVLLWGKLKKEKQEPLSYLLQYVHNVWSKRLFVIGTPLVSFLFPFMYLDDNQDNFWKSILVFAAATIALVYFSTSLDFVLWTVKLIITVIGAYGAYFTISEIIKITRFQNIIRQSILTGGNTYDQYVSAAVSKNIIDCLDKTGLAILD